VLIKKHQLLERFLRM